MCLLSVKGSSWRTVGESNGSVCLGEEDWEVTARPSLHQTSPSFPCHSSTMSIFGKIFGGGKNEKAPTAGEAIQKLRDTEEMLIKKQDFLEKKIQQEIKIAKQNGTKNKRGKNWCCGLLLRRLEPQLAAPVVPLARNEPWVMAGLESGPPYYLWLLAHFQLWRLAHGLSVTLCSCLSVCR